MIYLASPYSDPSLTVRYQRYLRAVQLTVRLLNRGEHVFCPIAYSHQFVEHGLGGDWNFWMGFDLDFIDRCDRLYVANMDGWEKSVGVQAELRYALSRGIEVKLWTVDDQTGEESFDILGEGV